MAFISQTSAVSSTPDVVLVNVPCDSAVAIGDWVKMDTFGVAYQALADSVSNSNTIGLVEFKTTSTLCNIRVLGVSEPIFSSLDVTKEYYLSDTTLGGMDVAVPTMATHVVLKVGQPFSSTQFLVLKGIRMERS